MNHKYRTGSSSCVYFLVPAPDSLNQWADKTILLRPVAMHFDLLGFFYVWKETEPNWTNQVYKLVHRLRPEQKQTIGLKMPLDKNLLNLLKNSIMQIKTHYEVNTYKGSRSLNILNVWMNNTLNSAKQKTLQSKSLICSRGLTERWDHWSLCGLQLRRAMRGREWENDNRLGHCTEDILYIGASVEEHVISSITTRATLEVADVCRYRLKWSLFLD